MTTTTPDTPTRNIPDGTADHGLETGWRPDTPVGDTVLRRYVCNLAAAWSGAAAAMGRRTVRRAHWTGADFTTPTGMFNSAVLTAPLPDRAPGHAIDEIEQFYAEGAGDVLLWSPWPLPGMRRRGWLEEGHPPLLLRPAHLPTTADAQDSRRIVQVADARGVDDWCRVAVECFPFSEMGPYTPGDLLDERILADDRWRLYVGYDGPTPVSIGTLFIEHGIAQLFLAVTCPVARGQGWHTAMTRRRLDDVPGLLLGALVSDLSRPLLESRFDFTAVMRFDLWRLPRTS